jgi:hypothetical protein
VLNLGLTTREWMWKRDIRRVLGEPRVLIRRRKAPALVWIAEGGWGCGQVDKHARTCLESGGCGQVDEDPRARLQSGGCVGRSTKDPCACLRSGGWPWGMWYQPKPSRLLGEFRVQWPARRRPYSCLERRGCVRVDETPHVRRVRQLVRMGNEGLCAHLQSRA